LIEKKGVKMIRLIIGLLLVLGGAGTIELDGFNISSLMFVLIGFTFMLWTVVDGTVSKKIGGQ